MVTISYSLWISFENTTKKKKGTHTKKEKLRGTPNTMQKQEKRKKKAKEGKHSTVIIRLELEVISKQPFKDNVVTLADNSIW